MGRVSGRRSRSYDLAGGSPYLPDEGHAMYRRARSCRQAATFRNFGPLFQKNAAYVIIRWRDPSVARVVSPRRPRNDLRSRQSFLKILKHTSRGRVYKAAKLNEHVDIVHH